MISCIQRCGKRQGQNRGEGLSGGEGVWRSSGKHLKLDLHIAIKKKKKQTIKFYGPATASARFSFPSLLF